jgi:hypothetical protein
MASVSEWFWCRRCHRAFRAEVWRAVRPGRPEGAGAVASGDIQGAVICPFGGCGAMHVPPWSVMCRLYEARFGVPYPQGPREGKRYEMVTRQGRAGSARRHVREEASLS